MTRKALDPGDFQVGEWRIRPSLNRIERGDQIVRLEPKVIALLVELARRQGNVLTKDEIFATVWRGVVVGDDVIAQAISKLRAALGEEGGERRYIETVWKKGYRLLAPVSGLDTGAPLAVKASEQLTPARVAVIAAGLLSTVLLSWLFLQRPENDGGFSVQSVARVTQEEGVEGFPSLSRDAAAFAYMWQREAGAPRELRLQQLDNGEVPQKLEISGNILSPVLSSDGTQIAMLNHRSDGCLIEVLTLASGETTPVGSCDGNLYADLAWSADGSQFAFSGRAPGERFNRIWLVRAASGDRRAVTSPSPGDWGDFDPAFTADGNAIVFVRAFSEAMHDLFRVDLAGGGERRISRDYQSFYSPLPAPEGDRLLVTASRGGPAGIWEYSMTGGPAHLVYQGPNAIRNLSADATFTKLLGEELYARTGIWRGGLEGRGGELEALIRPTGWSMHARPSPDGSEIAFVSNRSGRYRLWMADSDGGNARPVTDFNASFIAMPAFSPDGGRLAFDARVDGNADIYLINLAGGGVENLTAAGSADMSPAWSRDGRQLYFGSDRSGSWQIHSLGLSDGRVQQLTRGGGYYAQEADDGALYYTRFREPGLWRLSEGRESLVHADYPARGDWPNWTLSGNLAYLLIREGRPAALARFDLDTGTIEELMPLPFAIPRWDMALSIDAENASFLLARQDISEGDILFLELNRE